MSTRLWPQRILEAVSSHEGGYATVQRNLDLQGASFGILQWTQRGGGLGSVLAAMRARDSAQFDLAMDGRKNAEGLIAHVTTKSLEPLNGALVWDEPWLGRLHRAGQTESGQAAQRELALSSEYMVAAVKGARVLGIQSERAVALLFDRAVQQGPQAVARSTGAMAAYWQKLPTQRGATPIARLAQYAWLCGAPFRSDQDPGTAARSKTTAWKKVDLDSDLSVAGVVVSIERTVWHACAGKFDLWETVIHRSSDLLLSTKLTDEDCDFSVPR